MQYYAPLAIINVNINANITTRTLFTRDIGELSRATRVDSYFRFANDSSTRNGCRTWINHTAVRGRLQPRSILQI